MKHYLVVVDMQKDFVDGSLGTKEAVAIVPKVIEKIQNFDGELFVTYDTHFEDYLETAEGKKLPVPHCIYGTPGWELADGVREAVEELPHIKVQKYTFGSTSLPHLMAEVADGDSFSIELIGLCTDICVVSNALRLRRFRLELAEVAQAAPDAAAADEFLADVRAAGLRTALDEPSKPSDGERVSFFSVAR
jgi:nicotinamidase-related amidase